MAVAAKGAGSVGMDRAELKKSFKLARRRPMNVAFALDGDGKAVILCDKLKKGPNLFRQLKQDAPDSKNHRFGIVEIDSDNQKLAIFTVNRPGGGLAKRLIKTLKGTGYSKVLIRLDDGTEVESHEEEDETAEANAAEPDDDDADDDMDADGDAGSQEKVDVAGGATQADADGGIAPAQGAGGSPPSDAPPDASAQADASAPPDAAAPPDGSGADGTASAVGSDQQQSPALDAKSLASDLTGLVKQMLTVIAADPTKKAALVELATDAQANLKRGDLQQASASIDTLREAMGSAQDTSGQSSASPQAPASGADPTAASPTAASPTTAGPNGASPTDATATSASPTSTSPNGANGAGQPDAAAAAAAPAIAKARTAWVATRQKVEGDLGKLHDAFGSAFQGHDQEEAIGKAFRERVGTVLGALDDELSNTLDAVNNAKDPGERAQLLQQARSHLQRYQQHVASDPTIAAIDTNPFVPIALQKTVNGTIDALLRAIH